MFPKIEKNTFLNNVNKVAKISLAGLIFAGISSFASIKEQEVLKNDNYTKVVIELEKQNNFVLKHSETNKLFAYHYSHSSHSSHSSHRSHYSHYSGR